MTARDIIKQEYGQHSRNFLTAHILGYGRLPFGAYELSEGSDFNHRPMFGISVVRLSPDGSTSRAFDLSKAFLGPTARQDAHAYIRTLRRG